MLQLRMSGVRAGRLRDLSLMQKGHLDIPILNWGDTEGPDYCINRGSAVAQAVSKIRTFEVLSDAGCSTVQLTRDPEVAKGWIRRSSKVLCRADGRSGGAGITEAATDSELVAADFYSRYYPKTHEFRIHVFGDAAIDVTQKRSREGVDVDRDVRSYDNGWIFSHNLDIVEEDRAAIESTCVSAVKALGLDFGAVDVLAILDKGTPRRIKSHKVCEVNTAPGLESPTTIQAYVNAITARIRHA